MKTILLILIFISSLFLFKEKFSPTYDHLQGKFEIHITVNTSSDVEEFKEVCKNYSKCEIKPVLIQLPYGETASQLMTSSSVHGTFFNAYKSMKQITKYLEKSKFTVIRKKIELKQEDSVGIPKTLEEMKGYLATNYFEYHIKVAYPIDKDLTPLSKLAQKHEAHLSRSALKDDPGSKMKERFLTLRFYDLPWNETLQRRDNLVNDLQENDWEVRKIENEYAVWDSNVDVDRGWISH